MLFLLRLLFKRIWHRPKGLSFEKAVPVELRRTGNIYRHLDAQVTQQLILRCRQEKTTVNGALSAALIFAAARKIRAGEKKSISCLSSADLRRHLKPAISNENLGQLASAITSFHTFSTNTSFWELAREVRRQQEVSLKRHESFYQALMFRMIVDSALTSLDIPPYTAVNITNVGRVNIPRIYGQFELSEISFSVAQATFGGVFITAVTTFEGKMFLHFPFSEPVISQETIETLADSVLSCLVDVSS